MQPATHSIRPYFTHKRMLPKWVGLLTMAALSVLYPSQQRWLLIGIGLLIFFPSEYIVHRGVFHHFADKPAGQVVSKQHVNHHLRPDDLDYLFNDPRISITIGTLYFAGYLAATRDIGAAASFSLGNFLGLAYYEHVHLAAHRPGARPWTPWGRYLKRWHLWHHFKNEHYWFGVTQPLFDLVLRTYRDQKEVDTSPTVRTLVPAPTQEEIGWMRA